jgi:hypothetical protein
MSLIHQIETTKIDLRKPSMAARIDININDHRKPRNVKLCLVAEEI